MIDVCMTDLIPDKIIPWQRNWLAARKWSDVTALPLFDPIRDTANYLYRMMHAGNNFAPIVRAFDDGISLEWGDDTKQATFVLYPNGLIRHTLGYRGKLQELTVVNCIEVSVGRTSNFLR
jgi:hypothetical protein